MPKEMAAWKLFFTISRCIDDVTEKGKRNEYKYLSASSEKREP